MKNHDTNSTDYIQELENKIVDLSLELKSIHNILSANKAENQERIRIFSHNLKNPIGVAYSFAEMIADSADNISTEKLTKYIDVVKKSTKYSLEILNSLATINSINSPDFKLNLEKVNYCALLTSVVKQFEKEAYEKNCKISTAFSNNIINTNIDAQKITMVISNLLSNALRFSPNNTTIKISVIEKENAIETTITDQGIGISESNLASIFNDFFVVNTYCENNHKCIGLGLTTVKLILQHHKGKITVNSNLGNGTSVKFWIPNN